jgi:hypothetical protein
MRASLNKSVISMEDPVAGLLPSVTHFHANLKRSNEVLGTLKFLKNEISVSRYKIFTAADKPLEWES